MNAAKLALVSLGALGALAFAAGVVLVDTRRLRGALASHPRVSAVLAGTGFALLLIVSSDVLFLLLNSSFSDEQIYQVSYSAPCFEPDRDLGYRLVPGITSDVRKYRVLDDHTVYTVRYTIDARGVRETPPKPPDSRRAVAFFGCSIIFGEGVDDDETISSYFARASHGSLALNFAIPGSGTNHVVADLASRTGPLLPDLPEEPIGVYVFIDHHIQRNTGSMYVVNRYGRDAPFFSLSEAGELRRSGDFSRGRPLRSVLYGALGKSELLTFFGFDWPPIDSAESLELTAALVAEARNQFRRSAGSERFLVVFYPGSKRHAGLAKLLERRNVEFLDYSTLLDPKAPGMQIEHDGHPTPAANRIVAEKLAADLALRFER